MVSSLWELLLCPLVKVCSLWAEMGSTGSPIVSLGVMISGFIHPTAPLFLGFHVFVLLET